MLFIMSGMEDSFHFIWCCTDELEAYGLIVSGMEDSIHSDWAISDMVL